MAGLLNKDALQIFFRHIESCVAQIVCYVSPLFFWGILSSLKTIGQLVKCFSGLQYLPAHGAMPACCLFPGKIAATVLPYSGEPSHGGPSRILHGKRACQRQYQVSIETRECRPGVYGFSYCDCGLLDLFVVLATNMTIRLYLLPYL